MRMQVPKKVICGSAAGLLFLGGLLAGWYVARSRISPDAVQAASSLRSSAAQSHEQTGERKVLYWYDAMNPEHHYDKPGKAPDGMDLVPKYADETNASQSNGDTANNSGMGASQNQSSAKAAPQGERKVLYYYDAMNPAFHSDKPGKAPDGMDLVPKYADETQIAEGAPPGTVMISPQWQQLIGVRTGEVERKRLVRTIRTVGLVVPDETKIARVHVKIAGWVDKAFVDFVGKLVKKNQPLFSLYSPDLVSTEHEYLIARKGEQYLGKSPYAEVAQGAGSLLEATRQRLRLWDVSEAQIEKLAQTGKVSRTLTLYSPISGFVMKRNLYEQSYVTPQTELYEIADLSTIWVDADVYEYEVPYVHVGQRATMQLDYIPGKTYTGRVSYVYPTLDQKTRTVKVRLEFPNPGFKLKPDMYANVELKADYGTQTLVPAEAVLDSGTRQIVFLAKPDGHFEPREIRVGPRLDNQYVVLSGLKPGETIVTSGNFLVDSESQLQAALGSFAPPPTPAASANAPQAQIKFSTEPSPPAKGENTFRVRLTDAQGAGIAGAAVQVTFFMPGMPDMGMPPMRVASSLSDRGEGNYQGSGRLPSGGTWQVTVVAQRDGQTIATRQLSLSAAGGM
jgi:RND family efflux transporter MFP subunit